MFNQFFSGCDTVEAVKTEYRRLAMLHHPDLGGDIEIMKALNSAYHDLLSHLDGQESTGSDGKVRQYHYKHDVEQEIIDQVSKVLALKMPLTETYIIGSWIWTMGETRPFKDSLKELGFHWNPNRECWQWHGGPRNYRPSRGSITDLAYRYGVTNARDLETKREKKGYRSLN